MLQIKHITKSILKYKAHTGFTLLSLVISFTGIIILSLYISFENSFDSFHENKSSVFRVETLMYGNHLPAKLDDFLSANFPEIDALTVLSFEGVGSISTPKLDKQNIAFPSELLLAQNSFFNIFSFPLITGNVETVLTQPFTVVIDVTLSRKLFGNINVIGESILYNKKSYKVVGVMKDFPKNSSFRGNFIYSLATLKSENDQGVDDWSEWSYNVFLKLNDPSNASHLSKAIGECSDLPEVFKGLTSQYPGQEFFYLEPLLNIHFKTDEWNVYYAYVNPLVLNILIVLIIVLALMGIVNFINFSTAQAPLRSKALSIFQVMGAKKLTSMKQVVFESILISLLALVISIIVYLLLYEYVGSVFDINGLALTGRYHYLAWFVLCALAYGFIAGIYPSFYITSVPIYKAVKGNAHFKGKGKFVRHGLIVLQFVFTISLLISAFVIEKQLVFWRNFDIGINKEHVVYLNTSDELKKHYAAFADELLNTHHVVDYSYTQFAPGQVGLGWGREINEQFVQFRVWPVDENFIVFFDIQIKDGRKFSANTKVDIDNFIVNASAVGKFGWKNPLEQKMMGFEKEGNVIGVAKDFNFSTLKDHLEPLVLLRTDQRKDVLLLRLKAGNSTLMMEQINNIARQFDPHYNGEIKFLDEELQQQYSKEERIARFIELVAFWCILLALTGILGLMVFVSRDRIKEIGIRKVNGATVREILFMLNNDFVKWVAIAFVIACPIAYYAMSKWLESFAYKTELSWWIFALAGFVALNIALITVTWQSWRAATRNPVEALRYE
jgi:putative ABC transport system permease protein